MTAARAPQVFDPGARAVFGTTPDGRRVDRVAIAGHGLSVGLITWGATIQDVRLAGYPQPLVLGYPAFPPYLVEGKSCGAIVGRFANRIGGASAFIGGAQRRLDANFLGRHTLHGGSDGTGVRLWRLVDAGPDHATMTDTLPDGHMGFPGKLEVAVTYRIVPGPALEIGITATTDAETVCNFATHGYWNLDGREDISAHVFQCDAPWFAPVDDELIPTGDPGPVGGTRHDWRQGAGMADRLHAGLIDVSLHLSDRRAAVPRPVARLSAPDGPTLTVETTEPAIQVYAGAHLNGGAPGLTGQPYARFAGLALEPQVGPDAPNRPGYPDPVLRVGETYRQVTRFRFTPGEEAGLKAPARGQAGAPSPMEEDKG